MKKLVAGLFVLSMLACGSAFAKGRHKKPRGPKPQGPRGVSMMVEPRLNALEGRVAKLEKEVKKLKKRIK